jgi:hypothetical protein
MRHHTLTRGACAALCLCLAACGGDDGPGRLHLAVTDAPLDGATAVVVQFDAVEVKPQGGTALRFEFDAPKQVDLLALQGGLAEPLLAGVSLPAGQYNWLRLEITADGDAATSYLTRDDGSTHALRVPSGAESGLKLNRGFLVAAGGLADFTVDFDLRKSVHMTGGGAPEYLLRPTLRIVDNNSVGAIAGSVDPLLAPADCAPAVYVFTGTSQLPDDIGGQVNEPLVVAAVTPDPGDGVLRYRAAFLPPGGYTAAFTCEADEDAPDTDDDVEFLPLYATNVVVEADRTTTVDFFPSP